MRNSRSLLSSALRHRASPLSASVASSTRSLLSSTSSSRIPQLSSTSSRAALSTSPLAGSTSASGIGSRIPSSALHHQSRSHASVAPPQSDGLLCALDGDPYHKTYKVVEPDFQIVDSTLREGEQFATMHLTTEDKLYIAKSLDDIGVEYIEIMNPVASAQSAKDCELISNLGLKAKVASHVRCHLTDIKVAIDAGVDVIHMYMATSFALKQFSHGKETDQIVEAAKEAIQLCKDRGVEVRFSCEDTFRSSMSDLLYIYKAVSDFGVDRIGLADTVGVASPLQVLDVVRTIRNEVTCDMEYHTHNDTGCCIANALIALQGGVTHIDTCVLGLGERNGITPLGGFLARMYTYNEAYQQMVRDRYDLKALRSLEEYVAKCADVEIPFNNCVTGWSAFTHKAGVHSKAVLKNPSSYEVLRPDDFGVGRDIKFASRLTGWNAVGERATQLGLELSDAAVKEASAFVKQLADTRRVDMDVLDRALRNLGVGKEVSDGISCPASARAGAAATQTATA